MDKAPSMYPDLCDQTQFRLNKINKIKNYFIAEIKERELTSKRLSYYITASTVLFPTSGGVSIASFTSVIGAPVRIAGIKRRNIINSYVGQK